MNSIALAAVTAPPGEPLTRITAALLSPEQAADYLLLSISTLARMRIAGNGPEFS